MPRQRTLLERLTQFFRGPRRDGLEGQQTPADPIQFIDSLVGTTAGGTTLDELNTQHLRESAQQLGRARQMEASLRDALGYPGDTHNHHGGIPCDSSCPAYRRPPSTFVLEGDIHVGASRGPLPSGQWAVDEYAIDSSLVPGRSEYTLTLQGDGTEPFFSPRRNTPHSASPPRIREGALEPGNRGIDAQEYRDTAQRLYEGGVLSYSTYERLIVAADSGAMDRSSLRAMRNLSTQADLQGLPGQRFGKNKLGTFPRKKEE